MSHHGHDDEKEEKKVCVLLSTCPPGDAERLASFLVEKGHAACVSILPQVTSVYRWEGAVKRDSESLLLIKCSRDRVETLTEALVEEHPYDVPEVIAIKIKGGHPAYLDWVISASKDS